MPSKTQVALGIDLPLDTLQAIRFCSALLEADTEIHLPLSAEPIFSYLRERFGLKYSLGLSQVPILVGISVDHGKPECRLGEHSWPLVYPNHVIEECRKKWKPSRSVKFSFCGLVTRKRRRTLETWAHHCFADQLTAIRVPNSPRQKLRRLYRSFKIHYDQKRFLPDIGLCLFASDKGRHFPDKVWDEDYYDLLADSQFVLCPNGDFIWTYRFFEAIFCGAIPIVESHCSLYEGFEYYTMADSLANIQWSHEIVDRNFRKAERMLTVPRQQLNECLLKFAQ